MRTARCWSALLVVCLVCVLAAPASALTPRAGTYTGTTAQHKSITFKVTDSRKKVKAIAFGFSATCDYGTADGTTNIAYSWPIFSTGRFLAGGVGIGFNAELVGRFTSQRKAQGTVRYKSYIYGIGNCDSGKQAFTATKG